MAKYQPGSEYESTICTDPLAQQWSGWGTQLKPAHEPIALARKPIKLSIARNCQTHGVGALNIDATRIERDQEEARFPSNVLGEILQADYQKYFYCPKVSRRERHIGYDTTKVPITEGGMWDTDGTGVQYNITKGIATEATMLADMGGYYVDNNNNETKVTSKNIWLPQTGNVYVHGLKEEYRKWCEINGKTPNVGNNHPTVKPIELMKYLIKLITPPGGTVLDPFNGSGSTGCAAVELGHNYIGCELDPAYVEIAKKRIAAWNKQDNTYEELFECVGTYNTQM
jgi:site-specific DNA-methyltransferase (adenine-specific)